MGRKYPPKTWSVFMLDPFNRKEIHDTHEWLKARVGNRDDDMFPRSMGRQALPDKNGKPEITIGWHDMRLRNADVEEARKLRGVLAVVETRRIGNKDVDTGIVSPLLSTDEREVITFTTFLKDPDDLDENRKIETWYKARIGATKVHRWLDDTDKTRVLGWFSAEWDSEEDPKEKKDCSAAVTEPETHRDFIICYPPSPPRTGQPSVVLYGSIDKNTQDWRINFASSLCDLPITVLNPHRSDWDETWIEDISCKKFKEQVEWEMHSAKQADVIAFHFGPETDAPVSLLELGMYVGTGKVVVHCDPKFKKKGNVQIVCERHDIPLVYDMDELNKPVRVRLVERLKEST